MKTIVAFLFILYTSSYAGNIKILVNVCNKETVVINKEIALFGKKRYFFLLIYIQ